MLITFSNTNNCIVFVALTVQDDLSNGDKYICEKGLTLVKGYRFK